MELNHLSCSSITTWLTCPRSWKFKYIENLPSPASTAQVFGSAIHDCIETYLGGLRDKALVDLWPASWNTQLEKNVGLVWDGETPESLHNEGIRILSTPEIVTAIDRLQCQTDADGPVIERKIELRVPDVPIPVIGFIDMIDTHGIPTDFKTSSKSWSTDRAASEIQPLFYLAALLQTGVVSHRLRFRHVVFVRTKTPQIQVIESQFTFGNIFWLLEMVGKVWSAISENHFPCNPLAWCCSEKWCAYWTLCRGKS